MWAGPRFASILSLEMVTTPHPPSTPTDSKVLAARHVRLTDSRFKTSLNLDQKMGESQGQGGTGGRRGDTDAGYLFHPGDDWV